VANLIQKVMRSLSQGWRVRDAAPINKDLREFLVGQEIANVESGAQTDEGYSVTRLTFRGGDSMLIIPMPVEPEVTRETGVKMVSMFVFHPKTAARGRVWLPAHDGWWH